MATFFETNNRKSANEASVPIRVLRAIRGQIIVVKYFCVKHAGPIG